MVLHHDDDLELTIGQDFAVGYEGESGENVRLFVTESLTFRILEEGKIVSFS